MKVADLFQHPDPGRDTAIFHYARRHDHFAELEQLAWKRNQDTAGIEAGDIARLILRAYKAESGLIEEPSDHELNLPRWRTFPLEMGA